MAILLKLGFHRQPAPSPAPTPSPVPAPAPDDSSIIPPHLAEAWGIINDGRARVGAPRMQWDSRLAAMAQDIADWAQLNRYAGRDYLADAHHEFVERAIRHGWPWCDAGGRMRPGPPDAGPSGNWSECGAIGGGGKAYPVMSAAEHARDLVKTLTDGQLPRNEGHVRDFRSSFNLGGIGLSCDRRFFILEYGYLPDVSESGVGDAGQG
jgi:hypothetical protein